MPGRPGYFYGLTDRGPNADAPEGNKSEMVLSFAPEIGKFKLVDGKVTPQPVAKYPYGYDSQGLVALPDGTFWVSDEYGPYITHFDKNGFELGRLTLYKNSPDNQFHKIIGYLPAELADRGRTARLVRGRATGAAVASPRAASGTVRRTRHAALGKRGSRTPCADANPPDPYAAVDPRRRRAARPARRRDHPGLGARRASGPTRPSRPNGPGRPDEPSRHGTRATIIAR